MMNAMAALGYARVEYFAMRDAIKGIMKDFRVNSLAEVKTVIDKWPTDEDVKFLNRRHRKW